MVWYFRSEDTDTAVTLQLPTRTGVYVAVESSRDGVREIGDLCYDVERNVWKPAAMCTVPLGTMELYDFCFTRSMFVVNDVMYKVVVYEYVKCVLERTYTRQHPTVQILARSLDPANNGGKHM